MFGSSGFFQGIADERWTPPERPDNFYNTITNGIGLSENAFIGAAVAMSWDGNIALAGGPNTSRVIGSSLEPAVGDVLAFNNDLIIDTPSNQFISGALRRVGVGITAQNLGGLDGGFRFGNSIATNSTGTELYIGCPGYANSAGAILIGYVTHPITNSNDILISGNYIAPEPNNGNFGYSIELNQRFNNIMAIGGDLFNVPGNRGGSIYMYSRTNTSDPTAWNFVQKITCPLGAGDFYFGNAISIDSSPDGSEHYMAVGAYGLNTVYLYRSTNISGPWSLVAAGGGIPGESQLASTGASLALNCEYSTLFIGSPGADGRRGLVRQHSFGPSSISNGTTQSAGFRPVNGRYGEAMTISGDGAVLYVGMSGVYSGAAKCYYRNLDPDSSLYLRWNPFNDNLNAHTIQPRSGIPYGSRFGSALRTNFTGDRVIIGAPLASAPFFRSGFASLRWE